MLSRRSDSSSASGDIPVDEVGLVARGADRVDFIERPSRGAFDDIVVGGAVDVAEGLKKGFRMS